MWFTEKYWKNTVNQWSRKLQKAVETRKTLSSQKICRLAEQNAADLYSVFHSLWIGYWNETTTWGIGCTLKEFRFGEIWGKSKIDCFRRFGAVLSVLQFWEGLYWRILRGTAFYNFAKPPGCCLKSKWYNHIKILYSDIHPKTPSKPANPEKLKRT